MRSGMFNRFQFCHFSKAMINKPVTIRHIFSESLKSG